MSLLEEKDAIREVLAEYCFRLDGGDYEGMAGLFTEDGTWDTAFGKGTGRAAIAQLLINSRLAAAGRRPICQDTGVAQLFLRIGMGVRFERRDGEIRDGAHNPDGARHLVEQLDRDDYTVVASILADKDVDAMLRTLSRAGPRLVATSSSSVRALAALDLAELADGYFDHVEVVDDPVAAYASLPGFEGAVRDVTVDGFTGKQIEFTVPDYRQDPACADGQFHLWTEAAIGDYSAQEPAQQHELRVLDVEGTRVVIATTSGADTSAEDRDDLDEIERLAALRDEITRMLAAALETEGRHAADMERRDELHLAEAGRRDELHVHELERREAEIRDVEDSDDRERAREGAREARFRKHEPRHRGDTSGRCAAHVSSRRMLRLTVRVT